MDTASTTATVTDNCRIGYQLLSGLPLAIGISTDAGGCQLWVGSTDGEPIPDAPILLKVKPAAVCPGNCQVMHPLSVTWC